MMSYGTAAEIMWFTTHSTGRFGDDLPSQSLDHCKTPSQPITWLILTQN